MVSRKRMTAEHKSLILKLYWAGGGTPNCLAKQLGYSHTSVRDFIRRSGVSIQRGERGCEKCANAGRLCDFHRKFRAAEWRRADYQNDQKHLDSIVRKLKLFMDKTDDHVGIETDFNSTFLFFFWQCAKMRKMRSRRILGKVRRSFAPQAVNRILHVLRENRNIGSK